MDPPLLLTGVGCIFACESVLFICMGFLCFRKLLEFPGWAGYGKEDEADRGGLPSWSWGDRIQWVAAVLLRPQPGLISWPAGGGYV